MLRGRGPPVEPERAAVVSDELHTDRQAMASAAAPGEPPHGRDAADLLAQLMQLPLLWPLLSAASASETTAVLLSNLAHALATQGAEYSQPPEPQWVTTNEVALELPSMRLRDFSSKGRGPAALLCAPYALHGATIADMAPGHSLVESLRNAGLARLFVTDWRSAAPDMRYFSINTYLADLNVAVDELGPPVDLIGLCQGGWMALIYAARFPLKVRKLVIVGAPIDIRAGESGLSRLAADVPLDTFENLVRLGEGRVLGQRVLEMWGPALAAEDTDRVLQVGPGMGAVELEALERRFRQWYAWTFDLPGTYYLQVVRWLFKENRIAEGRFSALGRTIKLSQVRAPAFLLAARDDEIVAPEQLFAAAHLIGTARPAIEMATEPCGHLSLFVGAKTLGGPWRRIAHWLAHDPAIARAS
jgi:poly(3-hydroxyalkanoate) synthetase